jgi:hypothetical protein
MALPDNGRAGRRRRSGRRRHGVPRRSCRWPTPTSACRGSNPTTNTSSRVSTPGGSSLSPRSACSPWCCCSARCTCSRETRRGRGCRRRQHDRGARRAVQDAPRGPGRPPGRGYRRHQLRGGRRTAGRRPDRRRQRSGAEHRPRTGRTRRPRHGRLAARRHAVGVGVQVGAYSTRAQAEAGWSQLATRYEVLQGRSHRVLEGTADSGTIYRLQAVPAARTKPDACAARSRPPAATARSSARRAIRLDPDGRSADV